MNPALRDIPTGELFERALDGQRRALGRLLTFIERGGTQADEVTELAYPKAGLAHVVGITGAPGAGKSTLTGQLTQLLSKLGHHPAILAVDPSSPLTGGAILGDRIRMDGLTSGAAFIRSMATRGHSGGLALAVPGAIRLFDATGFNPVIIETVGVGQVEVDVTGAADTTIVVVTPGWGDAVQANKAGLLEVADIFVVNKADRPGSNDARRDLELMLELSHVTGQEDPNGYRPPIIMTTALDGTGANELWEAVTAHSAHLRNTETLEPRRERRMRMEVRNRVEQLLNVATQSALEGPTGTAILNQTLNRDISPTAAARTIADSILG